jgi:hypothetical protein
VTPQDFVDHSSYLSYVQQCELSMEYRGIDHDREVVTFDEVTARTPPQHWTECRDPKQPHCWCRGDEDGLIYWWTPGGNTATHTTAPMFTLKNDLLYHADTEPNCAFCYPEEFFWDEDTGDRLTREEADRQFWVEYQRDWDNIRELWSKEFKTPLPPYEPHKNGPHP